jgi:hypothetical protein
MTRSSCTRHPGQEWVSARPKDVALAANQALELAFKEKRDDNEFFFGSQIETGGVSPLTLMPRGSKDKEFTKKFLDSLRGSVKQLAPDIIDFRDRVFYEFKTEPWTRQGMVQLSGYYAIAAEIVANLGEPPWKQEYASWLPPATLTYPGNSNRQICTHLTNYSNSRGLIVYAVWQTHRP